MLSRPYCLLELREALSCGKPVQLLLEDDARFDRFDEDAWRRGERSFDVPQDVCQAVDRGLTGAITYRRRSFEHDARLALSSC